MKDTIRQALITGVKNALHLPQDTLCRVTFYSCTHISKIAMKYIDADDYMRSIKELDHLGQQYTRILQERLDNGEYCKESMETSIIPTLNSAFLHAFCRRAHPVRKWEEKMYDERVAWLNWLLVELEGETNE